VRGLDDTLLSLRAPHVTELCLCGAFQLGGLPSKLTSEMIARVAGLTSVRSLELRDWSTWDAVGPLASLPLLTRLDSDQGLHLLADIMGCGGLQNLEVASTPLACRLHSLNSVR